MIGLIAVAVYLILLAFFVGGCVFDELESNTIDLGKTMAAGRSIFSNPIHVRKFRTWTYFWKDITWFVFWPISLPALFIYSKWRHR